MPLPAAPALRLTLSQRDELVQVTRYPGTPQSIVLRCRVVLRAAGTANNELARQLSTSLPTVLLWRRRFRQQGLLGVLQDKARSGRPPLPYPGERGGHHRSHPEHQTQKRYSLECPQHGPAST